jgi:hypothetical protein
MSRRASGVGALTIRYVVADFPGCGPSRRSTRIR